VGGNPELVDEGTTGSLVPAADPDALAREVVRYFRDPALAAARGRAGRARAEGLFGIDAMVRRYCALYDELLGGAATRRLRNSDVAGAR
jgi:glycosyltransferase involved in cell wall biosynthesis